MKRIEIFRHLLVAICLLLSTTTYAEISEIDSLQLKTLIDQDTIVVDLRRADEWSNTGVIENSHLVTFFDKYGAFDSTKWLKEISAFANKDKPIALICHAGVRSGWVADWLDKNTAFGTIYNVSGGIQDWIQQGYTLVEAQ